MHYIYLLYAFSSRLILLKNTLRREEGEGADEAVCRYVSRDMKGKGSAAAKVGNDVSIKRSSSGMLDLLRYSLPLHSLLWL